MERSYKKFVTLISDHIKKLEAAKANCEILLDKKEDKFKEWLSNSLDMMENYEKMTKEEKKNFMKPKVVYLPDQYKSSLRFDYLRQVYIKNKMHDKLSEFDEVVSFIDLANSLIDDINLFGNVSIYDQEVAFLKKYMT